MAKIGTTNEKKTARINFMILIIRFTYLDWWNCVSYKRRYKGHEKRSSSWGPQPTILPASMTTILLAFMIMDEATSSLDSESEKYVQQALDEFQALYRQNIKEGWAAFSRDESSIGYQQTISGGKKLLTPVDSVEIRRSGQEALIDDGTPEN